MAGDVGDLHQVAAFLPVGLDLVVLRLEVEAGEAGLGQGVVDGGEAGADDVGAVAEGDEVVLLFVRHELLLGVGGILAQPVGLGAEVFHASLIFTPVIIHEVGDELADVLVGDEGGGDGIGVPDSDADEEAVAGGIDGNGAEGLAGGGQGCAGLEIFQKGALQDLHFLRGEGLDDLGAQALAVQFFKVGTQLHLTADGGIHHALRRDDGVGLFKLHRGGGHVHLGLAGLPVAQAEGNEQGERQGDPELFAQDDVVVAQRPPLDGGLVLVWGGRKRSGGMLGHRGSSQIRRSGT